MTAQTQVPGTTVYAPSQPMRERAAWYIPGLQLILADVVLLIVAVIAFWQSGVHHGAVKPVLAGVVGGFALAFVIVLRGITIVAPGRAHVIQLFGKYNGTIRQPGMQWV